MCLSRSGVAQHQRLQARVQDVRRDGVDQLHFEQLRRFDFVHPQPPAVHLPQVDLLTILVVAMRGKQRFTVAIVLIQIATLRSAALCRQAFTLRPRRSGDERSGFAARCAPSSVRRSSSMARERRAQRRRQRGDRLRLARQQVLKEARPAAAPSGRRCSGCSRVAAAAPPETG